MDTDNAIQSVLWFGIGKGCEPRGLLNKIKYKFIKYDKNLTYEESASVMVREIIFKAIKSDNASISRDTNDGDLIAIISFLYLLQLYTSLITGRKIEDKKHMYSNILMITMFRGENDKIRISDLGYRFFMSIINSKSKLSKEWRSGLRNTLWLYINNLGDDSNIDVDFKMLFAYFFKCLREISNSGELEVQ